MGTDVFNSCSKLATLIVNTPLVCPIGSGCFTNTPMLDSTYLGYYGSVYVPDNLVSQYQVATNWSSISDRITGISNLPNN